MQIIKHLLLFFFIGSGQILAQTEPTTPEEKFQIEYQKRIKKSHINGFYIPKDFEEALAQLDELIESEGKQKFASQPEAFAVNNVFFSFGRWILVNWGLEEGSRLTVALNEIGLSYPDDMVRAIMTGYHRKLNQQPILLTSLVKEVIDLRKLKESKKLIEKDL